ncbi:MAG: histidine kinase [Candidatus Marinimicrobia bacterium]|nr:histidine kinase [Candidatus Neomarinimicrobiota bacterium]
MTTLILIIYTLSKMLIAQHHDIKFDHISVDQGLSQSSVRCILQNKKGFMWFGTDDGLNKYDGYGFTVYKHDPSNSNSLSHNYINSIYEDESGILWIGTWGGGLNKYDPVTETFTRYQQNPSNPNSLSHNYVNAIIEDKAGILWVATQVGLNRLDPVTESFIHYMHDPSNPNSLSHDYVNSIIEDRTGMLWIGTKEGLNRIDPQTESFTHYKHNSSDPNSLSHDNVVIIYEGESGTLWIGTGGGIDKFDRTREKFIHYKHDPSDATSIIPGVIYSIYEDRIGVLWIVGDGVSRFDPQTEKFTNYLHDPGNPYSISYSTILTIYEDRSGTLWFGSLLQGLNKYDRYKHKFELYKHDPDNPNSLAFHDVRAIYEDRNGILWIGAGGLNRLDREKNKFTHFKNNPNAIFEDRFGVLWIGAGGLRKFDRATETVTTYQHDSLNPNSFTEGSVLSFCEDKSGVLWIGTFSGLEKYDRESETFMHYKHNPDIPNSLSDNRVQAIYEDKRGNLWIGTWNGGLNRFDREKEEFIRYQHDPSNFNSISNNTIHYIWEDDDGNLWIATRGGGLNKFNPETEIFTHYREKDGFPDDWVYGVLGDDEGNLWFSTNKGIARFNPESGELREYSVEDGLQSNEFNFGVCYKSPSGEMFFGGVNGFNTFFPDQVEDNPYPPQIVLTDFKLFNKPVITGANGSSPLQKPISYIDDVNLSYNENFFSFEFVALHYANPERNQYAYKLEGIDEDWIYSGTRRFARYTNIGPGEYVFRVKASNSDGVWNEKGISLRLTITPPFWKTSWAYGFYVLFLLSALYGVDRFQTVRLKREANREAEERFKIERAKTEEREKIYKQAAADFHDQVSGEVGIINMFSELIKLDLEKREFSTKNLRDHLNKIIDSSYNLVNFKNSFFWILESGEVSLYELANHLKDRGDEIFENTDTIFKTEQISEAYNNVLLPVDWKRNLVFIFIEGMNNILRHAECKNAQLSITVDKGFLELSLWDDGKGFDESQATGRGTVNMKKRAEQLNGKLTIISEPHGKTIIHFKGKIRHWGD